MTSIDMRKCLFPSLASLQSVVLLCALFGPNLAGATGIGGSGGGPRPSELVTVEVCDGGESGTVCRKVTYRVRPPTPTQPAQCTIPRGEAGEEPCPTRFGVPKWLRLLNEALKPNPSSGPSASSASNSSDGRAP